MGPHTTAAHIDDAVIQWNKRSGVAQSHGQPVQDIYLVGGPPDLKAMSGSTEDDRIIQLHFRRPATEDDRKWLLDAINAALGTAGAVESEYRYADRVTILQSDFESLMADRRELEAIRASNSVTSTVRASATSELLAELTEWFDELDFDRSHESTRNAEFSEMRKIVERHCSDGRIDQ